MTQDYRQPGPSQIRDKPSTPMDAHRRVVILTLYASAFAFMLAGVWLLVAGQSFFDAEIAPWVGMAFVITAVSDVVVVSVLKRLWAGKPAQDR